jgi:hypothetical protein
MEKILIQADQFFNLPGWLQDLRTNIMTDLEIFADIFKRMFGNQRFNSEVKAEIVRKSRRIPGRACIPTNSSHVTGRQGMNSIQPIQWPLTGFEGRVLLQM